MAHFGVALGAIVVTVITGAVVLDHTLKPSEKTAQHAAVAASENSPSTTVASASGGQSDAMVAEPRTAVEEAPSRSAVSAPPLPAPSPAKARAPSKASASKSNASPSSSAPDSSTAPSSTDNSQSAPDMAPPTTTPSPSTPSPSPDATPPAKPSEDQPPSKKPDA